MFVYLITALLAVSNFPQVFGTQSLGDFMKKNLSQDKSPAQSTQTPAPSPVENLLKAEPANPTGSQLKYGNYIELNATNHVALRGPVTENSVTMLMINMSKIEDNDIILYLSSPGGSVIAGQSLIQKINYLQHRGHRVHCVADFAASMAFAIMQACNDRYVMPSSILMQHQMSLGVVGQFFNIQSRMQLMHAIETDMTRRQASRMGISEDEFTQKITSDWWLYGNQSVENNAADAVVQVGCSKELMSETIKEKFYVQTFLGRIPLEATFSACPLAREPLKIEVANLDIKSLSVADQVRLNSEIQSYLFDIKRTYNTL